MSWCACGLSQSRSPRMRPTIRPVRSMSTVFGWPRTPNAAGPCPPRSIHIGNPIPKSSRNCATTSGVSCKSTPTTSRPRLLYFSYSADLAGASRRQFGHHVAKNPRSTALPRRSWARASRPSNVANTTAGAATGLAGRRPPIDSSGSTAETCPGSRPEIRRVTATKPTLTARRPTGVPPSVLRTITPSAVVA